MARQRKKHHFWRNLLILLVLFGIYLYWGNSSIETDEATSDAEVIRAEFDLSKNAFKRAVGHLYKERKIEIRKDSIVLK